MAHNLSALLPFDLNLLVAFSVLFEERSVTRAALRLGVTQPTLSHSLAKLREALDDPLFVRSPGGMVPTPRAEQLAPLVAAGLDQLARGLRDDSSFDPSRTTRTFRVFFTDYSQLLLLPGLAARLAQQAPQAELLVHATPTFVREQLESGELDLAVSGSAPAEPLTCRRLLVDPYILLIRRDHPAAQGELTLQRYVELPHLLVSPQGSGPTAVDPALAQLGLKRRVLLRISSFVAAPFVVAQTDHVLTIPRLLALRLCDPLPLVMRPPPLAVPPVTLSAYWHPRASEDPAHRWLRAQLTDVAAELVARAGEP